MKYNLAIFDKITDKQLIEAQATEEGVISILKRMTTLNGFDRASFMHELRETDTAHVLEENKLQFEIAASKL